MPNRSEYQPLAQHVDEEEEETHNDAEELPAPAVAKSSGLKRAAKPGHIDLSKLDTAFKRWTESIAQKVKRKKKVEDNSRKEIWHSVFAPQIETFAPQDVQVKTLDHKPPMTKADFHILVESVREAIADGIHPKMITKGSSGSYFARAKIDGKVQTVAVFKPKDEEPYGNLNPKTTKWLHRQFRWIIPFGRACLIPNLSYISEAAASLLDERLNLHIVPRTELVSLSSIAFYYHWLDRNAAKKGKPLPEKIGSMQYFLHGYTDASDFLRKHPWPGRAVSDTFDDSSHRKGGVTKKLLSAMKIICGKTGVEEDVDEDVEREDERVLFDATENFSGKSFYWSPALQDSFRLELEKLVILDYLMLNTDRGADNYMIKFCDVPHGKSFVNVAPTRQGTREMSMMTELRRTESGATTGTSTPPQGGAASTNASTFTLPGSSTTHLPYTRQPHIHIAAIDNSLSFPHEHPRGWRAYTYGWLYLPVTIIGRPFSQKTRDHFLPLLTSKEWWAETTYQLRKLFAVDPDFHPKMFSRQLAVIKGQAWNIVQSLKHSDEGPLELTRRQKVLVWDDEIELTEENVPAILNMPPRSTPLSPHTAPLSLNQHRRGRSASTSDFPPPPMRRVSSDFPGARPVSFSSKFSRVHPATTGVTVLEHMERLDKVEAGLKRLAGDEDEEGEEEVDVGTIRPKPHAGSSKNKARNQQALDLATQPLLSSSVHSEHLDSVPEVDADALTEDGASVAEEDLVAMSKSMPHLEPSPSSLHARWTSIDNGPGLDWMEIDSATTPKRRPVIAERLETVDTEPFFSCW